MPLGATDAGRSSGIGLYSDSSLRDPYDDYRELRDAGPVVYLEPTDAWAVARFDGVREALRDWERFTSAEGVGLNEGVNQATSGSILTSDPPDHTMLRRVLSDRLSPGAMTSLTERINQDADDLIASLVKRGSFDVVQDLAASFAISVVADLIGLPDEGRDRLLEWGNAAFDGFGPEGKLRTEEAIPRLIEMGSYISEVATRDRLSPGSMGLSVYEAADRGEIDAESCIPLMFAYVSAGMDTTISAIGTGMYLLATNPDQWETLRENPDLVRSAGNEILRYDCPVQAFARVTTSDQEIEGERIPAGERVLVIFGSANRDERKWPEADSFDVARNPIDHLGLGHGIHRCAGAALARVETEAILLSLTKRIKGIELDGEPVRQLNNSLRGFRTLPVSVSA